MVDDQQVDTWMLYSGTDLPPKVYDVEASVLRDYRLSNLQFKPTFLAQDKAT